jgi:hydroxyacylglutathione hydrolase
MSALNVELIPAFQDNYIYLLRTSGSDDVGVVDAGDAVPALAQLDRNELRLTHIFNTHHHADHIGGNDALKARFPNAKLIGPASETARIPGMDVKLKEGDIYDFGTIRFETLEVPGHTIGHIALFSEDGNALFCGDTLFAMGCGRMFEGTAPQMWNSLGKLRRLPPETRVYCAHEYTQGNARFALTVDPTNRAAADRADEIGRLRAKNKPTIPSTIGLENKTNPFLRADDPRVAEGVGLAGADPVTVFAEVRRRKDNF